MLLAQHLNYNLPPRGSLIPGTNQKFLYIQDFYTMTWGDLFAIPLILNAFAHVVVNDLTYLWIALPIAMVCAFGFEGVCTNKDHKPDYGFPKTGETSFAGILHLFYFGFGMSASIMCLWNIYKGNLTGNVLWVAVGGAVLYIITFIADAFCGNFDPLQKDKNNGEGSNKKLKALEKGMKTVH